MLKKLFKNSINKNKNIKIKKIISVTHSKDGKELKITSTLENNTNLDISLPLEQVFRLKPLLHHHSMLADDLSQNGQLLRKKMIGGQLAQISALNPQTLETTKDCLENDLILIFDKNLPSQVAYKIPYEHSYSLGQKLLSYLQEGRKNKNPKA